MLMLGCFDIESLFAKNSRPREVRGFHSFELGSLQITIVTDGHIPMKPVQPNFAPDISPLIVKRTLQDNFESTTGVDLGINVMVIRSGKRMIMIDSGCGSNFGNASGWLTENLEHAGIRPSDLTDIIITHAHPDHIGGLTDNAGKLVFPRAEVYISRVENDFWMSGTPDFLKSRIKDEGLKKLVVAVARKNIKVLGPRLHLVEDGSELLGCIKLQLAPGHTPGHSIIQVYSGPDRLYHLADLVHSAVLSVGHPRWGFDGDTDFNLAVQTRINVLQDLTRSRSLVFSNHLPWPGLGHIRKKGDGFEWIQQPLVLPD